MQTQRNQKIVNNKSKKNRIILFGSLLVFLGIFLMSYDYLVIMKEKVFNDMKIKMMESTYSFEDEDNSDVMEVPILNSLPSNNDNVEEEKVESVPEVDYSKYFGVLEIPKISLKRGFYNTDSWYNNIQYNVSVVEGSNFPDEEKGNLILMAHSGWSEISYFEDLYYLKVGDYAYVTYGGKQYTYQLVKVYDVEKNGKVKIIRDYDKTTLTLITCTRNSFTLQTVYILEMI